MGTEVEYIQLSYTALGSKLDIVPDIAYFDLQSSASQAFSKTVPSIYACYRLPHIPRWYAFLELLYLFASNDVRRGWQESKFTRDNGLRYRCKPW